MKTNKLIIFLLVLVTSISFTSCVEDADYEVPNSIGAEENKALQDLLNPNPEDPEDKFNEISISNLKGLFVSGEATEITSNIYVKGYVTSSDKSGNFYKEFFIQDSPSSPTSAIKVITEFTDSYNKYNFGRETYINLKGLFIGEVRSGDGVVAIGGAGNIDGEVENISVAKTEVMVLRSGVSEEIVPLEVKFSEINDSHVGMFIKVNNAQFPTSLEGKTLVDSDDQFDTQRTLESCDGFGYANFILETSAFADFGFTIIPANGGSISAVVSKTFNGSDLVLALNNSQGIDMTEGKCSPLDINDFSVILEEDFDTGTDNSNLNFPNWTNFAEEGNELWTEQVFSGNGYAEFSGFRTNNAENIGWLVSPSIDMSSNSQVFVNFQLAQHHLDSPENTLEVFVSTDFDGSNVTGATWEPISANIPTQADSWYQFKDAGLIDVSSYTGNLYVAFKYVGSGTDSDLDGAYMVDDFKVLGK